MADCIEPADPSNPLPEEDAERWAAIQRTLRETAPPPDLELGTLVARSMDAYWDERERQALKGVEHETAGLLREAVRHLFNPKSSFWGNLGLVALPALLVALTFQLPRWGVVLPAWLPYAATPLSLSATLLAFVLYWKRQEILAWGRVHLSTGTLAGSFLTATVFGLLMFDQHEQSTAISLGLAQEELVQISLKALARHQTTGEFLDVEFDRGSLQFTTERPSTEEALYKADGETLPGELVAEIGPESGELRWSVHGSQEKVQSSFRVGRVAASASDNFLVETRVEGPLLLNLAASSPVLPPTTGECIAVAFDPRTAIAQESTSIPCADLAEG